MSAPAANNSSSPAMATPAPWHAVTAAALQLAAEQIHELLAGIDLNVMRETLHDHPREYASLLGALVRLHESGLKLEKQRSDQVMQQLEFDLNSKKPEPGQGLAPDVLEEIEKELNLF